MVVETKSEEVLDQGAALENSASNQEVEVNETEEVKDEKEETDEAEKPKVEAYQPNFKYKVYDKEKEFPEWARPLVSSKELEENFRTLWAKSDALDTYKEKHESLRTNYEALNETHNKVIDSVSEMTHHLNNKDFGGFLKKAKIPEEMVIDWVKQKLQYQEMSPEQRAIYDQNSQYVDKTYQASRQAERLAQQNYELMRNQHEIEYERVMTLPEISRFKEAFEAKMGEGSLRKHADKYGDLAFKSENVSIPPLEAIKRVIESYKPFLGQETQTEPRTFSGVQKERDAAKPKGHIPSVGSAASSVSPARKRFKSIDEMKKYANELAAAEG